MPACVTEGTAYDLTTSLLDLDKMVSSAPSANFPSQASQHASKASKHLPWLYQLFRHASLHYPKGYFDLKGLRGFGVMWWILREWRGGVLAHSMFAALFESPFTSSILSMLRLILAPTSEKLLNI